VARADTCSDADESQAEETAISLLSVERCGGGRADSAVSAARSAGHGGLRRGGAALWRDQRACRRGGGGTRTSPRRLARPGRCCRAGRNPTNRRISSLALARNTAAAAAQPVNVAAAPVANIAGGTGVSPTEVNHTVTGDANLRITLGGAVAEGTTLGATASGELWGSRPRWRVNLKEVCRPTPRCLGSLPARRRGRSPVACYRPSSLTWPDPGDGP